MSFDQDTNWELIQFKYEILGNSLEQLAQEYHLSLPVLKFNAKEWKQSPLVKEKPLQLSDISSLEEIITKLGSQTETQSKAFAILKQKFLGPKYIELETVLLHKTIAMAENIKSNDPIGHRTLRSLTTVLADLLQNNPLLNGKGDNDEDGSNNSREWKITVVKADSREKGDSTEKEASN